MPADDDAPMPEGWVDAGYTEEDWRTLRAVKRNLAQWRAAHPDPPDFEDLVLEGLRELTALLREIRDRLPPRADR